MGVVYRAEQEHPRRLVALKLIRSGAVSEQLLRRFELEAEVLGRLDHPGIAQIFEASTLETPSGPQPFFAMELVDGPPLTRFAEERELRTEARLELLIKVCDAVNHAHRRGVIHRDLKPANILVREDGQPKVLDFGVARITDADLQVTTLQTDLGQIIGTLAYMSPEQVRGQHQELDIRSDVYALGVLGYELLTGRLPQTLTGKSISEAARIIEHENPSTLGASGQSFSPDLETIIGKCLQKEKEQRYGSAAELAADLRRFLNHEPISARQPSGLYYLRQFARRNRVAVAGVVAVFIALTAGLITSAILLDRAIEAEQVSQENLGRAQAEIVNAETTVELLQNMLNSATPAADRDREMTVRELLDRFAAELEHDNPEIEAALRFTIGQAYHSLREKESAVEQLRISMEKYQDVFPDDDRHVLKAKTHLAAALRRVGQPEQARDLYREAVAELRRVAGDEDPDTLDALSKLAVLHYSCGDLDLAQQTFEQIVAIQESNLGPQHSDTLSARHNLCGVMLRRGEYTACEPLLRKLVEDRAAATHPKSPETLRTLALLAGCLQAQQKHTQARETFEQILGVQEEVLGPEHGDSLITRHNIAMALQYEGRLDAAIERLQELLALRIARNGEEDPQTLNVRSGLATCHSKKGEFEEAEAEYSRVCEIRRRQLGPTHRDTLLSLIGLGSIYKKQGRLELAASSFSEALAGYDSRLGAEHLETLICRNNLATVRLQQGRLEDANAELSQIMTIARRVLSDDQWDLYYFQGQYGWCLLRQGQHAAAERELGASLAGLERLLGPEHDQTKLVRERLLELHETTGQDDKAKDPGLNDVSR